MDEQRLDDTTPTLQPVAPTDQPTGGPKRLHRSRDQKLFMGICGGLGEYFDIDPTIVRAIFAVGTLLGGASIVVYIVLLVIMPAEDQVDANPRAAAQSSIDEAAAEIQRGVTLVVDKAKSLTGRKSPPSEPS